MSTIEDYTTLKPTFAHLGEQASLSTIEDYTTLKHVFDRICGNASLSTIEDYTTLKPQILKFEETAPTTMR